MKVRDLLFMTTQYVPGDT